MSHMSTRLVSAPGWLVARQADSASSRSVSLPLVVLVVTSVVMAMELVRTTGPLLDRTYVEEGLTTVISVAVLTYAAPGLVVALTAAAVFTIRRGQTLIGLVGLTVTLGGLRLGAQAATATTRYWVGLAAAAVALSLVVFAAGVLSARDRGGALAGGAVAVGVAMSMSLHLAVGLWDVYWRHSLLGWAVAIAMVAVLVGSAALTARDVRAYPDRRPRRLWTVGPYLALALVLFGSVPFGASQSELPAVVAGPVVALAILAAAWLASRGGVGGPSRVISYGVPAAATVLLTWIALRLPVALPTAGVLVLLALAALAMAATLMLSAGLEPLSPLCDEAAVPVLSRRLILAGTFAGLGVIVPPLLYLVGYDTPLGFPNYFAMVASGVLLAVGGLHRSCVASARSMPDLKPLLAGAAALLVTGAAVAVGTALARPATALDSTTPRAAGSVRVMVWNLHYGVGEVGSLELEELARTIERHEPDVVLLNEVARGWLIGGGADMATWLSERLGGHFAYAPAADRQYGNAILSRWPLSDVQVKSLPPGDAPQNRSALAATVQTGAGEITVVATHLQVLKSNAPSRILELETLLPWLESLPSEVVVFGGDMNFRVGDEEEDIVLEAGYSSAIDEAGDPGSATHPSSEPTVRYDWLFGRGGEFAEASVLVDEKASDHLPVLVTLVP